MYLCVVKWINRVFDFFRSARRRIALAGVCSIFMLGLTWYSDRSVHTVGTEDILMRHAYLLMKVLGRSDKMVPDDILAVNVSYDRQLAPVCDIYGSYMGTRSVAHRGHLLEFLEELKGTDYKAILIDIFFDGDNPAPGDTALIALINGMDRIVVPSHVSGNVSSMLKDDKIASGDYSVNIYENDFVKYPFRLGDGSPSLALQAHRLAGGKALTEGRILDQPTMILPLDITMRSPENDDGTLAWYNLGANLLDNPYTRAAIPDLIRDKMVVIGDYVSDSDTHGSYVGDMTGPAIHVNALDALSRGLHRINLWEMLVWALAYMAICTSIILGMSIWRKLPFRRGPFVEFCLGFISFAVFLWILEFILYICFGKFHDTFLVVAFLSIYTIFCQQLNKKHPL